MDKKSLYDSFNRLEEVLQSTLQEVNQMKKNVQEVIEKNSTLEIENQLLRERLAELEQSSSSKVKQMEPIENLKQPSKARGMLEGLYNDGFHICNSYYGQRRENSEECLLCLGMIDRN